MDQVAKKLGVLAKLERAGLDSPHDLLMKSVGDLQRTLGIGESEILELFQAASNEVYPWKKRQMQANLTTTMIGTGDDTIDRILGGGVPLGSVTEVVGESSSGKTQLCLQLCLSVQEPSVGGAAVYLHSEGRFPGVRLDQMAQAYAKAYKVNPDTMKSAIHTMHLPDRETQYHVLSYQLPALLARRKNIRVIVIDSISAPFRGDNSNTAARFDRITEICEVGSRLKKLAQQYNVAVVAVNQVSDTFKKGSNGTGAPPELMEMWLDFNLEGFRKSPLSLFWASLIKTPVLGMSWASAVSTRIRLARTVMAEYTATRRALFVEFSPAVPRSGCEVVIDDGGIRGRTE
ncbi:P-loop containing nucleoside triphosphate hydrolase protein [Fennellomyces sp. T-0311]|nr:P-loop containing nucleoside triphosphate hydrolase protein [Fennellomyces sp. T-0311]